MIGTYLDHNFEGWSDFVATNFLWDTAFTIFFEAAQNSTYEPLRQRARKLVQEERIHFIHSEGWVRRLVKAGGAVRTALITALQRLWNETLCWFGPNDDPTMQQLYQEGIIDATPDELRNRYLQKIMPILSSLEIGVPAWLKPTTKTWELTQLLLWSGWDAVGRRLG
jgi:1,2-phenylacetyl-CoA epoxidase catalytic subunit